MQQLSWKNFPVKIEKSLCKLFGPKCAPNPVHNSVTIYSAKALPVFLCVKGSFTAPAARRLTRPLAPATVGTFSSPGRAIIKLRQSRPEGGFGRYMGALLFPKEKPNSLAKNAAVGFTITNIIVNLSPGLTVKVQGQHSGSHMGAGDGLVTDGEYLAGAAGLPQGGG